MGKRGLRRVISLVAVFWVVACDATHSGAGLPTESTRLGATCIRSSDCPSNLLCALGRCHAPCETSADCAVTKRCASIEGGRVCLLASEFECSDGAACSGFDASSREAGTSPASNGDADRADTGSSQSRAMRSCNGLPATCGASGNGDCCESPLVTGGTFNRNNDPAYPATISDFRLDKYFVTVGRFRKFVEAYPESRPKDGDGEHPKIPGSGWQATNWDGNRSRGVLTIS